MMKKDIILGKLQGKTQAEKRQIVQEELGMCLEFPNGICKAWFAEVFMFCNGPDFQQQLNDFLCCVNYLAPLIGVCFKPESTLSLNCDCPCGFKQVIMYYSLTPSGAQPAPQPLL